MTEKIAISLPDEAAEWIRTKVATGQATSVSAGIAQLIEADRRYAEWLRQEEAAFGEPLPGDPALWEETAARLRRSPSEVRADNEHELADGNPA
ncbi:ribbon-helix-helix domain-containing protein [Nonomuraea africana]|uniref:ribbon-helix-helix domain-containing protein n=1 Tax=Nonomuraea africana TaxID=46171 RepID=UPI0033DF1A04